MFEISFNAIIYHYNFILRVSLPPAPLERERGRWKRDPGKEVDSTIYYIVVAEVWARMSLKKNFIFASAQVKVISRSQFYPLYFEEILPLLNK